MPDPKYHIIFRTCDKVEAVNKYPRPYGLAKSELLRICFRSMTDFFESADFRITIIADDLSDRTMSFFEEYNNAEIIPGRFGNDASIRKSLEVAMQTDESEYVYFCEDDYLHLPAKALILNDLICNQLRMQAAYRFKNFIRKTSEIKPLFIFLPDYPDRYLPNYIHPSLIYHSGLYHWRQVKNVTFSFITQAINVRKYHDVIFRASKSANDSYLSKTLFGFRGNNLGECLCLSPLPGLATHMHEGVMTPSVDWLSVVKKYQQGS